MCLEATDALLSAPLLSHTMQCGDEWGRFTRDGCFARAVKFCNLEIIYFILACFFDRFYHDDIHAVDGDYHAGGICEQSQKWWVLALSGK